LEYGEGAEPTKPQEVLSESLEGQSRYIYIDIEIDIDIDIDIEIEIDIDIKVAQKTLQEQIKGRYKGRRVACHILAKLKCAAQKPEGEGLSRGRTSSSDPGTRGS
jgi:hypothetical protein